VQIRRLEEALQVKPWRDVKRFSRSQPKLRIRAGQLLVLTGACEVHFLAIIF
jgi:hypothetical protein